MSSFYILRDANKNKDFIKIIQLFMDASAPDWLFQEAETRGLSLEAIAPEEWVVVNEPINLGSLSAARKAVIARVLLSAGRIVKCFDCGKTNLAFDVPGEQDPAVEYNGKRSLGFCGECRGSVFWAEDIEEANGR